MKNKIVILLLSIIVSQNCGSVEHKTIVSEKNSFEGAYFLLHPENSANKWDVLEVRIDSNYSLVGVGNSKKSFYIPSNLKKNEIRVCLTRIVRKSFRGKFEHTNCNTKRKSLFGNLFFRVSDPYSFLPSSNSVFVIRSIEKSDYQWNWDFAFTDMLSMLVFPLFPIGWSLGSTPHYVKNLDIEIQIYDSFKLGETITKYPVNKIGKINIIEKDYILPDAEIHKFKPVYYISNESNELIAKAVPVFGGYEAEQIKFLGFDTFLIKGEIKAGYTIWSKRED